MIALCIMSIVSSVMVFIAYRQGLKDGRQVSINKPLEPVVALPAPHNKPTAEQIRSVAILENVNSYDGTPKNQKEVK